MELLCWLVDGICSKRLVPFLPELLDRLRRRGMSTTKAGTLLKRQIPIRTLAEWTEARRGFFEMDLVAHCGWSGAGQFLYTLSMVDMATALGGLRRATGQALGDRSSCSPAAPR